MIFVIVLLDVASSTFTRLVVLLVGLGYQIVIKSVRKYHVSLSLVMFLYAVTLLLKEIAQLFIQAHKIQSSVNFIT